MERESTTKTKNKKGTSVSNALMEYLYLGREHLVKVRSNRLHTLLDHILQTSGIEVLVEWSQVMGKANSQTLQVSSMCGRLMKFLNKRLSRPAARGPRLLLLLRLLRSQQALLLKLACPTMQFPRIHRIWL